MTYLRFMQAEANDDGPPARSPMEREARASGASFEIRDGWSVATGYGNAGAEEDACRDTVGFADVSQLGKLELQGPLGELEPVFGVRLQTGTAVRAQSAWWCMLAPSRALVISDSASTTSLRDHLRDSFPGHVLDVTAGHGALAVVGPFARELFARFSALDLRPLRLPVAGFMPGSIARTPGYVLRESGDRFLMVFGAAVSSYIWEVVDDAAGHLGGRPVGIDALSALAAVAEGVQAHA